ncbi:hypothetical protein B0O99DRAFT_681121 [Bisporella sp. PMI_857]|nr:hypothetical protein B0O99DRAFT_681121 [Bisporella sp. PMI_857]
MLPDQNTYLIDNQPLIDSVQAVYPGRGREHHGLWRNVRKPVFSAIRKLLVGGCLIAMTVSVVNDEADARILEQHLDIAHGVGVPLRWINLHCTEEVLEERATNTE